MTAPNLPYTGCVTLASYCTSLSLYHLLCKIGKKTSQRPASNDNLMSYPEYAIQKV